MEYQTGCFVGKARVRGVDNLYFDVLGLAVGANHIYIGRRDTIGQGHSLALGHTAGHQCGFSQASGTVIHTGVGYLHAIKIADQRLELIYDLKGSLAGLGLVGRVCRDELTPSYQRFNDSGDKVVVGACSQERRSTPHGAVLGGHLPQFLLNLHF